MKKSTQKALALNKTTISNLKQQEMKVAKGGASESCPDICDTRFTCNWKCGKTAWWECRGTDWC